ncbi:MAG TPA: glycosyltransferase 87 family protein [Polyangiaceae bacterium]|jgi:hypothetical protein|nr:glycosyltransferase 87 family protein [Polyangiaceae bacterium]
MELSLSPTSERRLGTALLGLAALGVVLRVIVMAISFGSNDMSIWSGFATFIGDNGLWETYRRLVGFNHPPLMGIMAWSLNQIALATGIGFRILWKLPSLAADIFTLWLLWRHYLPKGRLLACAAVALFACNPVSIEVTAYHGNTDSICGMFALWGALLCDKGLFFQAGLAAAGSANIKVIGLLFLPGLFLACRELRSAVRFSIGYAIGCIPILVALIAVTHAFIRNAFDYGSAFNTWGVDAWGIISQQSEPTLYVFALTTYQKFGKTIVLGLASLVAVLGYVNKWSAVRVGALTMAVFMVFTPGFGVQYMVWVVALLAATDLILSLEWALVGGAFLTLAYRQFLLPAWPLRSNHGALISEPAATVGLIAWFLLARWLLVDLGKGTLGIRRWLGERLGRTPSLESRQ